MNVLGVRETITTVLLCMMQQNMATFCEFNVISNRFSIFHVRAIKLLCDYNADPTLCDIEGNTPRDVASKHGHHKCASYLDNYIKTLMKSRINGSVTAAVSSSCTDTCSI